MITNKMLIMNTENILLVLAQSLCFILQWKHFISTAELTQQQIVQQEGSKVVDLHDGVQAVSCLVASGAGDGGIVH